VKVGGDELIVTLVHCKYSSGPTPGRRLPDLYELCGQALHGAKWQQNGLSPLLHHLDRRSKNYLKRSGVSPYEVGGIEELYRIRELAPQLRPRIHTVLAQPGLSVAACTDEHLRLLVGAEAYAHALIRGPSQCTPALKRPVAVGKQRDRKAREHDRGTKRCLVDR
jgi:hypothetical protein